MGMVAFGGGQERGILKVLISSSRMLANSDVEKSTWLLNRLVGGAGKKLLTVVL